MAYTPIQTSDLMGANLTGNEPQTTADGTSIPRVPFLTSCLLSGNRVGIYVQIKASMNPNTTVAFDTTSADGGGTVTSTTGTAYYISMNATAATSGDCIWIRTIGMLGVTAPTA